MLPSYRCRCLAPQRGFVLITAGIAAVILVGALGLAVDLGRLYIVKSEAQSFVDSAAIDAALQLDGTSAGVNDALTTAHNALGRYDLGQFTFQPITVEFATAVGGPWNAAGSASTSSSFVRVQVHPNVKLFFLPLLKVGPTSTVGASAVAAQIPKTGFREALFPFSPFAHNSTPPDFGLVPGNLYTLRWPSNPTGKNACPGDATSRMIASERGFIENTASSTIRSAILGGYQSAFRQVGDVVDMTGGAKQTQLDALDTRILQDTDTSSQTYSIYKNKGAGNGRRIVAVPINDGGTPPGANHRIVSIAAFFLRPSAEYGSGGGEAWCAEYIGAWVQGSTKTGVGQTGAWVVRLVQ